MRSSAAQTAYAGSCSQGMSKYKRSSPPRLGADAKVSLARMGEFASSFDRQQKRPARGLEP